MNLTGSYRQKQDNNNNNINIKAPKNITKENINMGGQGSGQTPDSGSRASSAGRGISKNIVKLGHQNRLSFGSQKVIITPEKPVRKETETATATEVPILGLADAKRASKAPLAQPMVATRQKEKENTTYKIKILYRQKVKDISTDVVAKTRGLLARFFQYETSIQLLPYDPQNKSNPIVSSKDIPSEVGDFQVYVPFASVNNKTKVLKMNFRISCEIPLWKLKNIPPIKNFINQYHIYLDQTYLHTTNTAKVGGLILSHCQFTRRDAATKDLNIRINENEATITPIQLCPYTIWNDKNGSVISTKVLAVECGKENIKEVKRRLFSKLFNTSKEMELSNTRFFKFIPFTATGAITDRMIRSGIYLQNKFLTECTAITIIHLSKVDWIVPNTNKTFSEMVLSVIIEGSNNKVFTSLEMGTSDNKAHMVTTKGAVDLAKEWMDNFTKEMLEWSQKTEYWKSETGFDGPPERIDRPDRSDAHQAYANFLDQTFTPLVGKEEDNTAPKVAPSRPSYSRVVYGKLNKRENENQTQTTENTEDTSTSSLTGNSGDAMVLQKAVGTAINKMRESHTKDNEDMKKSLLDEMRALNQESTLRVSRIEESTKSYEKMLVELHNNNKAKAEEMANYEKRFAQIGKNTAHTANKVDKLSTAMKAFINVMADVFGPNNSNIKGSAERQEHLKELATFLDEEEENTTPMEIDEYGEKRKWTPSPDTEVVLGGEGIQK